MNEIWSEVVLFLTCAVALYALGEIGVAIGRRYPESGAHGVSTIHGAVFALIGLLLTFTFAGAQERFQYRRGLVIAQANAIGTAYLRVDLLDPRVQPEVREDFERYVRARIAAAAALPDMERSSSIGREAATIGRRIWSLATIATSGPRQEADRRLMLDALNRMLDIALEREVATGFHLPAALIALLGCATAEGAILAGRSMAPQSRLLSFEKLLIPVFFGGFLTDLIDLDHPRVGLIQIDAADAAMASLLDMIVSGGGR